MNRSSVAIALAGFLAACALLFVCVGVFQPLFWVAAVATGTASYLLWRYGRERILAVGYGGAGLYEDGEERGTHPYVTAEDWHRGGFEYRTSDPSASDDDWDDWRWPGAFWHERNDRRSNDATTERTTTGRSDGRWHDDDHDWWTGWDDETPGETAEDAGDGRTEETTSGDRRRDEDGRTTGTAQQQLSRSRGEAAAVLGVDADASPETVRAAYRERVKATHPDCGGDEETFRRVRWAYDQLRE